MISYSIPFPIFILAFLSFPSRVAQQNLETETGAFFHNLTECSYQHTFFYSEQQNL